MGKIAELIGRDTGLRQSDIQRIVDAEISLKVNLWENDGKTEQEFSIDETQQIAEMKNAEYKVYR
ncbi:MAG: hypothetical protein ACYCPW_00230 [Nitrososphaerales archaeon]